jgi:hypothetical protein
VLRTHPLLNARQGLRMALHRACDDGIKRDALRTPVFAQALALLPTQSAELVVVGSTQRGLPVSH